MRNYILLAKPYLLVYANCPARLGLFSPIFFRKNHSTVGTGLFETHFTIVL